MTRVAHRRARLHAVRDCDADIAILADGENVLIPPSVYEGFGGRLHARKVFGQQKAVVAWTVLVPDEHADLGRRRVRLECYYNVRDVKRGQFVADLKSRLWREAALVLGRRPQRRDRLSPRVFENVCCEVLVATVTRDRAQYPLGPLNEYSVVRRVLRRKAGGSRP